MLAQDIDDGRDVAWAALNADRFEDAPQMPRRARVGVKIDLLAHGELALHLLQLDLDHGRPRGKADLRLAQRVPAAHIADVQFDHVSAATRPCALAVTINERATSIRNLRANTARTVDGGGTILHGAISGFAAKIARNHSSLKTDYISASHI